MPTTQIYLCVRGTILTVLSISQCIQIIFTNKYDMTEKFLHIAYKIG